jgi:outer membrane protein assembly factor BamB
VYAYASNNLVRAWNVTDGTLLWTFGPGNAASGIARTPAVAKGILYFGGADGVLYALNAATGTLVWQYATGASDGFSPTVSDGVVYATPASQSGNTYAFDAATGAILWTAATGAAGSQPAVSNGRVYVTGRDLTALDAKTGSRVWSNGRSVKSSPTIADGRVYVVSYFYFSVYAFNAATGELLWTTKLDNPPQEATSVAQANGLLYVVVSDGTLHALDAYTGRDLYETPSLSVAAAVVANGVVYAGSGVHNNVYAMDKRLANLATYVVPSVMAYPPAVVNGVLYALTWTGLNTFHLPDQR